MQQKFTLIFLENHTKYVTIFTIFNKTNKKNQILSAVLISFKNNSSQSASGPEK